MTIILAFFVPSLLSIIMLTLGSFLARNKDIHSAWGVLAGTIVLLQGVLLVGAWLLFGVILGGNLLAALTRNPLLCAGFALWLPCLVARTYYSARGRKKFTDPKDHDAA